MHVKNNLVEELLAYSSMAIACACSAFNLARRPAFFSFAEAGNALSLRSASALESPSVILTPLIVFARGVRFETKAARKV